MSTPTARWQRGDLRGLPGWRLVLEGGRDSVFVAEQGAQVLSWVADGEEQFYLSERAVLDGRSPIRGGVPVCMPQFNQRGTLPKHGFARTRAWAFESFGEKDLPYDTSDPRAPKLPPSTVMGCCSLRDDDETRALWPHAFEMVLGICLGPGTLSLALSLCNRGQASLSFTGALHSYFSVDGLADTAVTGLSGAPVWDAVRDVRDVCKDELRFEGEFDRVYTPTFGGQRRLRLHRGTRRSLDIVQTEGWADTVVWNPGADKARTFADVAPGDAERFVCIEAACVHQPVTLAPGADWHGEQILVLAKNLSANNLRSHGD